MRQKLKVPVLVLLMLLASCAAIQLHPGAVNKEDSTAYDALVIAQAIIEQARTESAAGTLPANLKAPLNILIDSYNVARASWLTYRAAVKAKTPADVAGLKSRIDALTASLNAFNRQRSIP